MSEKIEVAREKLLKKLNSAMQAVEDLKVEYKAFNKENPLSVTSNPTPHELRQMRDKLGSKQSAEHVKVNQAMANKVAMSKFVTKE